MAPDPFSLIEDQLELDLRATKLKADLPLSSNVYNSLLLHSRQYANCYEYYVLRDHGDSNIVLWKNKTDQMGLGIHCPEQEVQLLEKSLRSTSVIDFSKSLCVFHVPDYMKQIIQDIVKEEVGQELTVSSSDDFLFDVSHPLPPLKCPAGFKVYRLGKAGVNRMHSCWRYKSCVPLEEIEKLTKNVATAGVYEAPEQKEDYIVDMNEIPFADEGTVPLSWASATANGPLSMQMTEEEYRGRGFASLLSQVCAKMMAADGFFPYTSIEEDLPALRRVFEKLPGWSFKRKSTWMWQMVDPEGKVMASCN